MDLGDHLDPPDGERIWFSVKPPAPLSNTVARWSRTGRAKWMSRFKPNLKGLFQRLFDQFLEFLEFPKEDICRKKPGTTTVRVVARRGFRRMWCIDPNGRWRWTNIGGPWPMAYGSLG
jgi:hypothetical protein